MYVLRCGVSTTEPSQVSHSISLFSDSARHFRFFVMVQPQLPSVRGVSSPVVSVVVRAGFDLITADRSDTRGAIRKSSNYDDVVCR